MAEKIGRVGRNVEVGFGSVFIAKSEYSERKASRQPCRITERYVVAKRRKTQLCFCMTTTIKTLTSLKTRLLVPESETKL